LSWLDLGSDALVNCTCGSSCDQTYTCLLYVTYDNLLLSLILGYNSILN
jgi:hypothetical protein